MRTRFLVIHNPRAGPQTRGRYQATLEGLTRAGASLETVETARHGEGMAVAAVAGRSGRFDAILAAGGDGTVHDVAEGLLGCSSPLGIIPLGTADVFARELNLPRSPLRLAELLLRGEARSIPVGDVNGRPFLFVVGVGFDAAAVRLFEQEGSRTLGRSGFAWPVLRALFSHSDRVLRVQTDLGTAEATWVLVTRTKRYAANLMLAPHADLLQPTFYVLQMNGSGPGTRLRQLSALAIGGLRYDPGVRLDRARWVRIDGDARAPVQIDGEVLGALPLDIGIHPQRLTVILPSA